MAILQSTEISGSLSISGSLTAQSFVGDGSSITGVVAVAPAGTVSCSAQVVSLLGSHSGNVVLVPLVLVLLLIIKIYLLKAVLAEQT